MGMSIDELKKECQYCCREIDNSGLEGFLCTNGNAIKARDSILCDPKNANEPCSICEYCKPGEEPAKQQKMDINECITWLKILRANMNTFPEVSAEKKIEALTMAIKLVEQEPKTGEWIKQNDDYFDWYECSECGYGSEGEMQYSSEYDVRTNYCPCCGARMEEVEE